MVPYLSNSYTLSLKAVNQSGFSLVIMALATRYAFTELPGLDLAFFGSGERVHILSGNPCEAGWW